MDSKEKYVIQLLWHINDECNLRCKHCYRNEADCRPVDRWNFQLMIIDRICELQAHYNIIRVGLLGGEPLMDPNLIMIIQKLHQRGIKRIDISTNGIFATRAMAESLKSAGVQMIQVSLEGPTSKINDYIRGKGSFQKATIGLRNLRDVGIQTGIMMTVMYFNFHHIRQMAQFAFSERMKIVSFNRMLPLGFGKTNALKCLEPEQLREMIALTHQLDSEFDSMDVSSDDPMLYVPSDGHIYTQNTYGGCGAGISNLAICHDGTVFPCRRLPINVGNVAVTPLIDIINSSDLDCFYDRRKYLKGKCQTCAHTQICGGCRASALAFTGDHLNPDPQCYL